MASYEREMLFPFNSLFLCMLGFYIKIIMFLVGNFRLWLLKDKQVREVILGFLVGIVLFLFL